MAKGHETATIVIISYRKNRRNHRLVFGRPRMEIRRGWHRKLAAFYPGDVFGYERWRANKYGTQDWRFVVAKARKSGCVSRFPGLYPGAELLLNVTGKTRVKRAYDCLDRLKTHTSALETVPEHHWREVGCRLLAGEQPDWIIEQILDGLPC